MGARAALARASSARQVEVVEGIGSSSCVAERGRVRCMGCVQDAETGAATGLDNLSAFHDELRQRSIAAVWYWQMHWWLSLVHVVALGVLSTYNQRLGMVARSCVLAAPDLIIILGITAWLAVVRQPSPLPYDL
jgi:hypothetical protein